MKMTPFVWLGANRARKWPVGQKALLLDKAASASLPVPSGAILMDELFTTLLEAGVVTTASANGQTSIDIDPDWLFDSLYKGIRLPRFDRPMILRAAFSALTDAQQPVPSAAKSGVAMNDPETLAQALSSIWSGPPSAEAAFRRDVLVMEMVQGEKGTAVTTQPSADTTPTDTITTHGNTLEIPQLTGFFPRTDSTLPPAAQRLQKLLNGIRRTFGAGIWQVDWLDDGKICWVVKVAEGQGNEVTNLS